MKYKKSMKRLFAAAKINAGEVFLETLETLKKDLERDKINWTDLGNIHITLKFFGETNEDLIPSICDALDKSCRNIEPFNLKICNTGIFGSRYDPRVIWFGIDDCGKLGLLNTRIVENLKPLGYEADRQNFVPHLTLGRIKEIKDKKNFQNAINKVHDVFIQDNNIDELCLFESKLLTHGPVYTEIMQFCFSGSQL